MIERMRGGGWREMSEQLYNIYYIYKFCHKKIF